MFDITKILNNISPKAPIVIFMRHADKHTEIMNKQDFICNGITNNVKLASKNLAKKLDNRNIEIIKTIPVKRCIETSEIFATACNKNLHIQETVLLGSPGAFIKNVKIASTIFLTTSDIN